ncbi:acid protease [Auriscalpium vulgare]|uniref:Acid protease n=1 Tax=Auriscalpium vulgare TaxID=40419 RepID=A0ACB8S491_9AGAM|nr:acid protease [Auriscalpium vulgare]
MRYESLPSGLIALSILCANDALAAVAPHAVRASELHIPLMRRAPTQRTDAEWGLWAKHQRAILAAKYSGASPARKRASGYNLIVNENADSSYYGSLAVGTPPVAYSVILDTGSSDLWLAGSSCTSGCDGITTFASTSSSSFQNKTQAFSITYGSGKASGVLGQDVVQMAGFEVNNQIFGVCDTVSSGLLNAPVAGLMGLAWQSIAASGATPFWQTLYQGSVLDQPLMAFQLTRFQNVSNAQVLEPGGTFTLGNVNSSLYTGDIDYQNVPSNAVAYWTLPLTALAVNGNALTLPSGSGAYAAIDTGTTLVGGPADQISALFAQIPGSAPGSGNYQGYYTYPCTTNVTVTLAFGGQTWAIAPEDFALTKLASGACLGAFFEFQSAASAAPAWIVGDTFLKNVYAVFRASPVSVGFAALSADAAAVAADGVPTATVGAVSASVTGSGRSHANAGVQRRTGAQARWVVGGVVLGLVML